MGINYTEHTILLWWQQLCNWEVMSTWYREVVKPSTKEMKNEMETEMKMETEVEVEMETHSSLSPHTRSAVVPFALIKADYTVMRCYINT